MPTSLQRCRHAGCFPCSRLAHVAHHRTLLQGFGSLHTFDNMLLNAHCLWYVAAAQDVAWEGTTAGPIRTVLVQRWISGELGL